MMRTGSVLASTFLALSASPAWGASACDIAATMFSEAVAVYKENGKEAFMERFLRDSPLRNKLSVDGAQHLQTVEKALGPFQGGSVLSSKSLGDRACYVVAVLEFESGPAFTAAMYYSRKEGAVPLSFRMEAEPEKVFSTPALIQSRSRT